MNEFLKCVILMEALKQKRKRKKCGALHLLLLESEAGVFLLKDFHLFTVQRVLWPAFISKDNITNVL